MSRHLLVFGAGALVADVVRSLVPHAPAGEPDMRITIASRDPQRARWIAAVVRAHAAALGRSIEPDARAHDWRSVEATAALVDAAAPDLVLHAASYQSAPMLARDSRWSRFVRTCGYGVTAPLQLALARHLQAALAASRRRPLWINACHPDLVNPCLALDEPAPLCGIGNVAIIAEHVRQQLGLGRNAPLSVVAAHLHVVQLQRGGVGEEPLPGVWVGAEPVDPARLAELDRLPDGPALNAFSAARAAELLWSVMDRRPLRTHVPAPEGLPGGYPVRIGADGIGLDLPAGIDRHEAVARNAAAVAAEGAALEGEFVRFSLAAREALRDASPVLAEGFSVRRAAAAAALFLQLREEWQREP